MIISPTSISALFAEDIAFFDVPFCFATALFVFPGVWMTEPAVAIDPGERRTCAAAAAATATAEALSPPPAAVDADVPATTGLDADGVVASEAAGAAKRSG